MQTSVARLDALNRRLDNVQIALRNHRFHDETMTSGGKQLLDRSESLLAQTRKALHLRWERTSPLDDVIRERARRTLCDDFSAAIRELAITLLPALDGALSSRVPVELEPVLKRIAGASAPTWTCQVLLYAAGAFNYSIEKYEDPVDSLVPSLGVESPKTAPYGTFLFLRIPGIDRDCATLHTIILGHELGHLRDWSHRLVVEMPVPEPETWCDVNGQLLLEHVNDYRTYVFIVRAWRSELVADIFAAFFFGPASLNALSELVGNLGVWRVDSSTHPGMDRRAKIIVMALDELGFLNVESLGSVMAHFNAETQNAFDRKAVACNLPGSQEVVELAWELVLSGVSELIEACKNVVPEDERFDSSRWGDVEEAASVFAAGVPFGELLSQGEIPLPIDDAVIINGAWLVRTDHLGDLGGVIDLDSTVSTDASQVTAVLDALVLKSFEISELRRSMSVIP